MNLILSMQRFLRRPLSAFELHVCVFSRRHTPIRALNYPASSSAAAIMTRATFQSQNSEQTERIKPNLEQKQSDCLFSTLTKSDQKGLF